MRRGESGAAPGAALIHIVMEAAERTSSCNGSSCAGREFLCEKCFELTFRRRDLPPAPGARRTVGSALANPAHPKLFPPRANQFQATRPDAPCAPTICRRVVRSHGACARPSFAPSVARSTSLTCAARKFRSILAPNEKSVGLAGPAPARFRKTRQERDETYRPPNAKLRFPSWPEAES